MTGLRRAWFVYVLECRGGRLYTGITTDIERRMAEHDGSRRGARFTRANPPAKLRAAVEVADRSAALKLEAALKRLRRSEKLAWLEAQAARAGKPAALE
ncbi:MAG TPA: GIY-YIG nuclease family protein [Gammaproteobacteria bacterium]|jgi:putative endonuclease|nr:GIY-YIG nuclease family protein [Gammaproteobacteria bacterium]